jgi:hypothetical protein
LYFSSVTEKFLFYELSQIRKFMCHEREQLRLDGVLPSEEVLHASGQVGAQYGLKLLASCSRYGPATSNKKLLRNL